MMLPREGSLRRTVGRTRGAWGRRGAAVLLAATVLLLGCASGDDQPEDRDDGVGEEVAGGAVDEAAGDDIADDAAPDQGATPDAGDGGDVGSAGDRVPPLHPAVDRLPEAVVTLETADDEVEVVVRVAADDASRRRGLMEVADLPPGYGMLFVFDDDRDGGFWMWNTLTDLDIAFADEAGEVHTVATMTPCDAEDPADCPVTTPDASYRTALEVPGGWFEEVGVTPGARLAWRDLTDRDR